MQHAEADISSPRAALEEEATTDQSQKCWHCGKCFALGDSLRRHLNRHFKNRCKHCGECFPHKEHLHLHLLTHKQDKPYKCEDCAKCFRNKSGLKTHIRTHSVDSMRRCKHFISEQEQELSVSTDCLSNTNKLSVIGVDSDVCLPTAQVSPRHKNSIIQEGIFFPESGPEDVFPESIFEPREDVSPESIFEPRDIMVEGVGACDFNTFTDQLNISEISQNKFGESESEMVKAVTAAESHHDKSSKKLFFTDENNLLKSEKVKEAKSYDQRKILKGCSIRLCRVVVLDKVCVV